jgi:chemotaxis protein histidine kinase CheA
LIVFSRFVPASIAAMKLSLESLDNKRLGKQRVESYQIWRVINGLTTSKAWRRHQAVHMWRGYPEALGVYLYINCQIWARRTSATTGLPFSNKLMETHIKTYGFGKNAAGQIVYQLPSVPEGKENGENADEDATSPIAVAQISVSAVAAAEEALSSTPAHIDRIEVVLPAASVNWVGPAGTAPSSPRPGKYIDGIRIPWWFHDPRVHDSDAGALYHKDPRHYKAFRAQGKKYSEYVWPIDINPLHPEQRRELDVLNAELEREAQEKAERETQKKAQKARERERKKEQRAAAAAAKRKRAEPEEEEESTSSRPEEADVEMTDVDVMTAEKISVEASATSPQAAAAAAAASPRGKSKRARKNDAIPVLTPAASPSSVMTVAVHGYARRAVVPVQNTAHPTSTRARRAALRL